MNRYYGLLRIQPAGVVMLAILIGAVAKCLLLRVGAPYVTIDDFTAYEGGFLVWFGQVPPQRMYLESWIYGLVSVVVFLVRSAAGIVQMGDLPDLVTSAYRDFYGSPDSYVAAYRSLMVVIDAVTAGFIFLVARKILANTWSGWAAAIAGLLYIFTPSTFWMIPVARPDTVLALFCAVGVYCYVRSEHGARKQPTVYAGIFLGLAAGMKLHGALMAIFVCLDILRVQGLRQGFRPAALVAAVSFLVFSVAAGSVLFDPILYAKIRTANYIDDKSPWIAWGEQFVVVAEATGWIPVVGAVAIGLYYLAARKITFSKEQQSCIFLGVLWLILFLSIRQLRAYWTLPGLVAIYPASVLLWTALRHQRVAIPALLAGLLLLVWGSSVQVFQYRKSVYDQYTAWADTHLRNERFYVWGFNSLALPRNTQYMKYTEAGLNAMIASAAVEEPSFARRHARTWEERSRLQLIDMLNGQYDSEFEYFDYYNAPPDFFAELIELDRIKTYVVQEGFDISSAEGLAETLATEFTKEATVIGAGGGADGLAYHIFRRIDE